MRPLAPAAALAWLLSTTPLLAEPGGAPFGAGAGVRVTCSRPVEVFIAPLDGPDAPEPSELDFKTVGVTPLSSQSGAGLGCCFGSRTSVEDVTRRP